MRSLDPKEVTTAQLHGMMLSAVGPRPICFASTVNKAGIPNLSPFSFFNMFSANPPVFIFSPSRRVRNNTVKHTFDNVKETREVVINVVNFDLVQQASLSSTEYSEDTNEFEKAGLHMLKSEYIRPFRVAESPVQFECKVLQIVELGKEGGAGNLIISEVLKMHVKEEILDSEGKIDQQKLDLVARMGGNWYTRAKMGMFEVPKPLTTLGIGVDRIPKEIRNSNVLTGNDLGKLGNVENLPSVEEITAFFNENQKFETILSTEIVEIHSKAKEFLEKNDPATAWKILLAKKR